MKPNAPPLLKPRPESDFQRRTRLITGGKARPVISARQSPPWPAAPVRPDLIPANR